MASWSPADITTLLWLDGADSSTITIATGISQWADKSGNARHATQAVAANQPAYVSNGLNGQGVARFDGSNDTLAIAAALGSTVSIFYVQNTTDSTYMVLNSDASNFGLTAQNGATTAMSLGFGTPTLYKDGALQSWTNRDHVHDGLTSAAHVVGIVGATISTWTAFKISGYTTSATYLLSGDIAEVLVITGTPTTEERQTIEGYLAWKWGQEADLPSDHPYKTHPPGDLTPILVGLEGLYGDVPITQNALVGVYGLVLETALVGRYGDASRILASLVGRYRNSSQVQSALVGRYGDTVQVLAALDGRYHLMHSVLAGMEGRYAICGAEVLAGLEGRYDLRERNEILAALVGYYSLLPGATLQSITCPVLIGGVAVKWSAVQWTISESSYLIEATISLRDGAEFNSISKNDQVTITWQGTVYTLFVAAKLRSRSVSGSPGSVDYGVDYTIVARSLTAGLDEPYALPVTMSWPATTMQSAIAAQLVAPLADIISLDWRLEDHLQPGGTFFLTDETPLAGLRKLAGIVGGILQTSPDNALIIRKADPVAPRYWPTATPAWTVEDSGLFSDSESEDISSLYNVVTVTNQSATDNSTRFETEKIDDHRHRVKGYRVPWADFTLATSGGDWVTIEDMGIAEEQIVETVEFIDGFSSTTSPVYSTVSAVWLRTQLGAITGAEDGSLTAEVNGCSLAEVTYTTRYHAWIGRSDRSEEVQFYAVELNP